MKRIGTNNVNQYLTALEGPNFWRLFVDGGNQTIPKTNEKNQYNILEVNYGHLFWAAREPNGLNVLKNTAQKLFSEDLDKELSFDFIKGIHHSAYPFQDYLLLSTSYMLSQTSRNFGAHKKNKDLNWIRARAKEIQNIVKTKKAPWDTKKNDGGDFEINSVWTTQEKITRYKILHKKYEEDLASKYLNKLEVIVQFMQDIELLHIFADGNCRMIYLLLNKELMKHGFDPVILFNPNEFDYKTKEELIKEIKKGQQAFKHFIETGMPYDASVSDEQIAQNITQFQKKIIIGGEDISYAKYSEFIETAYIALNALFRDFIAQGNVNPTQDQLLNYSKCINEVALSLTMKEYMSIMKEDFNVATFCTNPQHNLRKWIKNNGEMIINTPGMSRVNDFGEYLNYAYIMDYIHGKDQSFSNNYSMAKLIKCFKSYLDELKALCEKYMNDYDIESLSNPLLCHLTKSQQEALKQIEEISELSIESLNLDVIEEVPLEIENLGDNTEVTENLI